MSNNVDNRVVQMTFDNAEFERNVKVTQKSIDGLKDNLEFDKQVRNLQNLDSAMKSFGSTAKIDEQTEYLIALNKAMQNFGTDSNIEASAQAIKSLGAAAEQVDVSPASSAVDEIGVKLNALDAISWTVFSNIAQSLIDFGENIWNSSLGQIIDGGLTRALNLEQAQFQLEGLGVDWKEVTDYGVSLYDQIDKAVSGTAYGLDASAKVASQLVASNIEAGSEVMQEALSGISGVAAMTNSTYEEIGSIFTTIAGNGKVMTEQVRQFSYRGLNMAATLAKYLTEVEGVITTEQGVYERLSDKDNPISSETFFKAASWAYAEQATKANETYTGSLSNVKSALSRLGEVIQTPKLKAMRDIFVATIPVVNGLKESLLPMFDVVIDGMNFVKVNAVSFLKTFAYWDENNKTVLTGLTTLKSAMQSFKDGLNELDSKGNSALDHFKQTFFNVRDALTAAINTVKTLLNIVFSGVKTGLFGDSNPYLTFAKTLRDISSYVYSYILDIQKAITVAATKNNALQRIIAGLTSLINIILTIRGVVIPVAAILFKWAVKIAGVIMQILAPIADLITYTNRFFIITKSFMAPLKNMINAFTLVKNRIVDIATAIKDNFLAVVEPLFPKVKKHVDGYKRFSEIVTAALQKVGDFAAWVLRHLNHFLYEHQEAIESVGTAVGTAVKWIIEHIQALVDLIKKNKFLTTAGTKIKEWFNGFVEGIKSFKTHIQEAITGVGQVKTDALETLGSKFKKSSGPMQAAGKLFASIFNFLKSVIKAIGPLLSQVFTTISDGFSAILGVLSNGIDGLKGTNTSAILAGGGIFAILIAWAQKLVTAFSSVKGIAEGGVFNTILSSIVDYFASIKKTYKPKIIESFANGILKIAFALLILSTIDPASLASAIGALSAVFAQFSAVINTILNAGNSMTIASLGKGGLNYSGAGTGKYIGITSVIVAMGTAVLLLASAMKVIAGLNPEQLATGLAAVSALLWELTAIIKVLSSDEKRTAKGISGVIAMAIAVKILVKAVAVLGGLPIDAAIQGTLAIIALVSSLTGAIILIGRFAQGGKGVVKAALAMVVMAVAVRILVKAVASLGELKPENLIGGLLAVVTLIGAMTAAFTVLNGNTGLIKAALAMVVMSAALAILGKVVIGIAASDPEQIALAMVAVVVMVTALTAALNTLSSKTGLFTAAVSMVLVAAAMVVLAQAIKQLDGCSPNGVIQLVVSMGALLGLIMSFENIGIKTILKTAVAIFLVGVGLGRFAKGLQTFANLSWETLAKAGVSMAAMLLSLGAFSELLSGKKLKKAARALVVYAGAMLIFFIALRVMNGVEWSSILKAVLCIGIMIGAVGAMEAIKTSDVVKFAAALLILAVAMPIFAVGMMAFTLVPIISIIKGLVALALAIVVLSKAAKVLDVKKFLAIAAAMALLGIGMFFFGEGLVLISAGLTAFVGAIVGALSMIVAAIIAFIKAIIELIPWIVKMVAAIVIAICDVIILTTPKIIEALVVVLKTLLLSIVDLAPALGEAIRALLDMLIPILVEYTPVLVDALIKILIGIINALAERLPELLLAIANFFKKLIGAFAEIAKIEITEDSMTSFLLGLTVFSLCLVAIAAAAYIAQKAIVGMLLIVAVIVVIVAAFLLLNTIDMPKFVAIALGLSAVLIAIAAAMAIVSVIPIAAAVQGIAGLAIFVAGLTAVLVALGAIAQIDGVMWLIEEGTAVMTALGNAIGSFVGAIIGGLMEQVSAALPAIGTNLSDFMTNLQPFLEGAKNIDQQSVEAVLSLVGVIVALTAAEIIQGFANFISGGIDFAYFGEQLVAFAPYVVEFANIMSQCDNNALVTAADAAAALALFAANIPNSGGVAGFFAGENDLSLWGPQLPEFANNLVAFSNVITDNGGIDVAAVKTACEAGSAIAEMASSLPNQGGVASWFAGENSMEVIAPQLAGFAEGLVDFSNTVSAEKAIDIDKVKNACEAGKAIAEMASKLPNQGGVASWFAGENSLEVIAPQLSEFALHLYRFAHYAELITDTDKAINATKLGVAIADMASSLPNQGGVASWFAGDNTLEDFGGEIAKFGEKIATFSDNVKDINWSATNAAIEGLASLIDMAVLLDDFDKNNVTDFANAIENLGKADVEAFLDAFENASDDCADAASTFVRTLCGSIRAVKDDFTTEGNQMVLSFRDGINQNGSYAVSAFKTVLANTINASSGYNQDIFWIGANFCVGIANGIYMNEYQVINAAIQVATDALQTTRNTLGEKSPSKEGFEIGKYLDYGFANGVTAYGKVVNEASRSVSADALGYFSAVHDVVSDMDFTDDDPTIRPVVDLSRVRAGVGSIGRIMNNTESYRISSSIAKERAEYSKRTNTIKVESTSKDVVEAVGRLEDRIDSLGDRLDGMALTIDGKAVVGELTDPLDKSLGRKASRNNGGVVVGRVVQR